MLSWNEYLMQGKVRKTQPNRGVITALIRMANNRISTFSAISLTEQNASVIFANYYDALRELCEAIALVDGYKIYSHEAIGLFFREVLKDNHFFMVFDRFRTMRNGVNYYGTSIPINEASQCIDEINQLILKMKSRYLKEFL